MRVRNRILYEFFSKQKIDKLIKSCRFSMGGDGFEPSKSETTDLQSAPFGHSGTLPDILLN